MESLHQTPHRSLLEDWMREYKTRALRDAAVPGQTCLDVAVRRPAHTEYQRTRSVHVISFFLDIAGFYDTVRLDQYPPLLLCLSLQVYRGPRVLCGEGVSSLALYPQQGISKLAMFDAVVPASQMPGVQHCDLWLDDCSLDVTHADADIVAAQALEVYRCLKTDLPAQGLQINVKKTHSTCSSAKAEKCLKKIFEGRRSGLLRGQRLRS